MQITDLGLALLALASIGVILLLVGILVLVRRSSVAVDRFHAYSAGVSAGADEDSSADLRARSDEWLARKGIGGGIARSLAQADIRITLSEYILLHLAIACGAFVGGLYLLHSPLAGLVVALLLLPVPHLYVGSSRAKRAVAFSEQLPNALSSLSNALRGGYGIVQAMSLTAEEMAAPMSTEFRKVVAEVGYGLPYDVAFQNMLRRNPTDDLGLVVTALEIHLEMGGNLSVILDNIAGIIRDRVRIQGQIRTLTAQQRLSSRILISLPFIVVGALYFVNRKYISQLWTTQEGLVMTFIAGTLLILGIFLLRRVSAIKV